MNAFSQGGSMAKIVKWLNQAAVLVAVAGLLFMPIMVSDALAIGDDQCTVAPYTACWDTSGSPWVPGAGAGFCSDPVVGNSNTTVCGPEMSDYLAMAFIVVAGGILFYFRRRRVAVDAA